MFVGTVLKQVASSKSVDAGIGTGPVLDDIRSTALAVGKSGAGVGRPKEGIYCGWSGMRRGNSWATHPIALTDKMEVMPPHRPSSATRPKTKPEGARRQADRVL